MSELELFFQDEPTEKIWYFENKSFEPWFKYLKTEYNVEITCEKFGYINHSGKPPCFIVNQRKYKGKDSFLMMQVSEPIEAEEFNGCIVTVYKDVYGNNVLELARHDVPCFDSYDRMYDGDRYLFFFHNGEKITAMKCFEGYQLGSLDVYENILTISDNVRQYLEKWDFPVI